jgi:hypothetical protein
MKETRSAYRILVGTLLEIQLLVIQKLRWDVNITKDLRETGCENGR